MSQPRLTIAHCIHGLGLGGAQQVIREIVAGSDARAFRHVVLSPEGGVLRADIARAGADVHIVPRTLAKMDPFWVPALAGVLRREHVDVVHTHLFGDSLHGYLAAQLAGRLPVVMTLHCALEALRPLQQRGYRWLLNRGTCAVACSESVRRSYAGAWGGAATGIRTIVNGIAPRAGAVSDAAAATAARVALGVPADAPIVGGVGRLEADKAYDVLVEAFARTRAPDALLVLVGDGSLAGALKAQATRLGLGERVRFVGFRDDVRALLPAFDVFAMSSPSEGLPIALLEAMAAARCIVATGSPGVREVLTDDVDALVAPPGDADALARALDRALGEPGLRARFGAAARTRFAAAYSAAAMVAAYEDLYEQLHARRDAERNGSPIREMECNP